MVGSTLCLVNLQLERSVSWLRRNWGKRNFGFDSLKSRLKLVSRLRRPWSPQHGCRGMRLPRNRRREAPPSIYITRCQGTAAGSGQRGSGGRPRQQSRAIIPFSSMWRFSLYFRLMWKCEEPETSENPTQSFKIHYIFWRHTQLLAVIIYSI